MSGKTSKRDATGTSKRAKAAKIREIMEQEGAAIETNTQGFNDGRYESVARLEDYQGLKDEARAIKEDAIDRLPELIEELRESVEENGGTVYLAEDEAENTSDTHDDGVEKHHQSPAIPPCRSHSRW